MEMNAMRSLSRALPLLLLLTPTPPAAAYVPPPPEPLGIVLIGGDLQPVPPIIDIGRVKPKTATVVSQTLNNECELAIPVQSITVVDGTDEFELISLAMPGSLVKPDESFIITVAATGEGSGIITGQLLIDWGGGFGSATLELVAYVDLVDASIPELAVVQTGFEGGLPGFLLAAPTGPAPLVTSAAALQGEKGLAVSHAGGTTVSFVQHFFPDTRGLARSEVWFDPNSFELHGSTPETILQLSDYGLPIAWLELQRVRGPLQIRVAARLDNGTTAPSAWLVLPDEPTNLVFDWWVGKPNLYPGGVRVRLSNGTAVEHRSTSLNFPRARSIRFGAVANVATATEGTIYFDDVTLRY
jgi:hypothetical protein